MGLCYVFLRVAAHHNGKDTSDFHDHPALRVLLVDAGRTDKALARSHEL